MILVWDAVLDLMYAGTPYLVLLYNLFIYLVMPILSQAGGAMDMSGVGAGVGAGLGVGSASPGNYSDRIQGLNFDSLGFDIFGTSNTQLGGTFG